MRTIKKIHLARYCPIEDLITYSPLPSEHIDQIDPFLQLNHYGPQCYIPDNNGLPFIPHPHQGIETVTFVLEGDLFYRDSRNHENVVSTGGIQWMTAGRGLIHEEDSSDKFKEYGGKIELLQVWINLPARYKLIAPRYIGLPKEQIPSIKTDDDRVEICLIAGEMNGYRGVVETLTDITLTLVHFNSKGHLTFSVKKEYNIFFYVVRGILEVNLKKINRLSLVEFYPDHEILDIIATKESMLLFGFAEPLKEPLATHDRFVMNDLKEIREACRNFYQNKADWRR
jgi:redox-sensitive bicupin YhaK (pirin superfamily)